MMLSSAVLDKLMPLHAVVSSAGQICHVGPTLAKLSPEHSLLGQRFLEAFEVRRPRIATRISDLMQQGAGQLSLRLRRAQEIRLRGLVLPLDGDGTEKGGAVVNLSFGFSMQDAIRAFDLSASDFAPTELAIEMLYLIEAKEAVTSESRNLNMRLLWAKTEAEEQAFTDTLTGLKNRRAMDMILARYASCGEVFGLMHLDLDHFKAVNDTLGHAAGDAVLVEVARILTEETRTEDAIIRTGGDEFVLLFHRLTDALALSRLADRILKRLQKPIAYEAEDCRISGSIGITISTDYSEVVPEQMLIDADMALYAAKNAGRAQQVFVREVGGVGQSAAALSGAASLHPAR